MNDQLIESLLSSAATDNLVIFCGAGLSMAAPSSVPSAKELALTCATKYEYETGANIDDHIRNDLERLAQYFKLKNELSGIFTELLVPWDRFRGEPNNGHRAIADFLSSGVVEFVISTNLDNLIESAAKMLGENDFRPIVKRVDINAYTRHNPLLKLHGCCVINRYETIWCVDQVLEKPIEDRLKNFSTWIAGHILARDILIIGFWSDWKYLNNVLLKCLEIDSKPRRVIIIDPLQCDQLKAKAPYLWEWANGANIEFHHHQESGETFLNEFRRRFSIQFLKKVLHESEETYQRMFNESPTSSYDLPNIPSNEVLYLLRRDINGVNSNSAVRIKTPTNDHNRIGALHLRLLIKGATHQNGYYEWNGKNIRLINGRGLLLSQIKQNFVDSNPIFNSVDKTVCVGAMKDGGVPHDLIRSDSNENLIRSTHSGNWITDEEFIDEIGS